MKYNLIFLCVVVATMDNCKYIFTSFLTYIHTLFILIIYELLSLCFFVYYIYLLIYFVAETISVVDDTLMVQ